MGTPGQTRALPDRTGLAAICLSLFIGAFGVAGCSTTLSIPVSRFDTPESLGYPFGAGKGRVEPVSIVAARPLKISGGGSSDLTSDAARAFEAAAYKLGFNAGYSVLPKVDLSLKMLAGGPTLLQARYQLMGQGQDKAKGGDLSAAVFAGVGMAKGTADNAPFLSPGGAPVTIDMSYMAYDFAGSAGYRVFDSLLTYAGGFLALYPFSGVRSTETSAGVGEEEFTGSAKAMGAFFGLQFHFDPRFYVKLEASMATASSGSVSSSGMGTGLAAGLLF